MATASNITFDAAVSPIKISRTIITTPSLPEITNDTIMPQSSLQEVCMAIKLQMEVDLAHQYRAFFKETERQPSAETVKSYIQMATETAQTAVTSQLQGTVITDITRRMNEMMLKVSREASKISTSAHEETEPAHFTTLNKVVGELAGLNVDMTATRRILAACAEEKKRLTAQLRHDVQITLANETQATGVCTWVVP